MDESLAFDLSLWEERPMTPDEIKAVLKELIRNIALSRGSYIEDIRAFSRCRSLPVETVIKLLLCWDGAPINRYLYDCGLGKVSASAFVQQRAKIHPQAFYELLKRINEATEDAAQNAELFNGLYRLIGVDGTSLALPLTVAKKNPEYLVVSKTNPTGVCLAHYNTLYSLSEHRFLDCVEGGDEQGKLIAMLYKNRFTPRDIIIADRGYLSYNCVAHLSRSPAHFLIRARENNTFRDIARLIAEHPDEPFDETVSVEISTRQTNENKLLNRIIIQTNEGKHTKGGRARWDFAQIADPYTLTFRCTRFRLDTGGWETLISDLPTVKENSMLGLSADELKRLYYYRWRLETAYAELKYAHALINVHSRKIESIQQEVFSSLIIYNITRLIADSIAINEKNTKLQYKTDMTMASKLVREFILNPHGDGKALIQTIASYRTPVRPNRQRPRNIRAKGVVPFTYRVASG